MTSLPLLQVRGLVKRFRGVMATDRVALDLVAGSLHGLIGPNGAGKTTLINLLSGELSADDGHISFRGVDVTRMNIQERARLGIVRSYQITSLFLEMTVLQNVMLAVQVASGRTLSLWTDVMRDRDLVDPARQTLQEVGLMDQAERRVTEMAHGARRQLELAMVLVLKPALMLLDEPFAGMSGFEARAMVEWLRSLKTRTSILLVEHDMDAVFSLADRVTVLVAGRPIMTGTPEAIRADAQVQAAYLGIDEHV